MANTVQKTILEVYNEAFAAGQKVENKEWREGRRCPICGKALVIAEQNHTYKCPNDCIKNLRMAEG